MKLSAGIAIYCQDAMFLVHPTKAPWKKSYSIPKGLMEPGEEPITTAIRELKEETGIALTRKDIPHPQSTLMINYDQRGSIYKQLIVFFLPVNGSLTAVIPDKILKSQLQLNEVDWAGFVPFKEVPDRILPRLLPIFEKVTAML